MELSCEKKELALDRLIADNFTNLDLLNYATAPRNIIAGEMDAVFDNVFLTRENNVNELIAQVIKQLDNMRKKADKFERVRENRKAQKVQKIRISYQQAMRDIDAIAKRMLGKKIQLSSEARLYNDHKEIIFREYSKLSEFVSNLKKAIDIIKEQVSTLRKKAESTNEMGDIEKCKIREDMLRRMEIKLCDLEKSLLVALQAICQLNIMIMNNTSLCEQMQNAMFEGMSSFKNNIIIIISNREAKAASQLITSVIGGVKLIKIAQENYDKAKTESKKQKAAKLPENLADIEMGIARLRESMAVS
jgi:uncharacterized protein YaaN involved in tellurite resistance